MMSIETQVFGFTYTGNKSRFGTNTLPRQAIWWKREGPGNVQRRKGTRGNVHRVCVCVCVLCVCTKLIDCKALSN